MLDQNLLPLSQTIAFRIVKSVFKKAMEAKPTIKTWHSETQFLNHIYSRIAYLDRDYLKAIEFARQAVSEDSTSIPCLNNLANLYLHQALSKKEHGEDSTELYVFVKQLLKKSLTLQNKQSEALRLMAELYMANERWGQAEFYLKKAYQINPLDAKIYFDFTKLHPLRYKDLGFKNEKSLLSRAIYLNPCFVEAYLALANFYELRNRLDMAIKTIKNLLQINPNLIPGLMALGKLFLSQGDLLNVLTTFEKVINLDPQNADAYYNLGIVYYHNKDYPNAIEFFNKAIEVGNHANAHLYLAYIYELRGEMDRAIEELRTRIRMQKNEKDRFAEEARKHLFEIMKRRGVIDSLLTNAEGKHQ